MDRRGYLATVAAVVGTAGCTALGEIGPDSDAPDSPLTITAPTVAPGESGAFSITARSARGLTFFDVPDWDRIKLETEEFSPSPDSTLLRYPPTWLWSSPTTVSGEVEVSVAKSTPPGTYEFGLRLGQEDDETVERTAALTVREE